MKSNIFFLVDSSGFVGSRKKNIVKSVLDKCIALLKLDIDNAEDVYISIINIDDIAWVAYNDDAQDILLNDGSYDMCGLGKALYELEMKINEVNENFDGDCKTIENFIVLITTSSPQDEWCDGYDRLDNNSYYKQAHRYVITVDQITDKSFFEIFVGNIQNNIIEVEDINKIINEIARIISKSCCNENSIASNQSYDNSVETEAANIVKMVKDDFNTSCLKDDWGDW